MRCPNCGEDNNHVVDGMRPCEIEGESYNRRRRECYSCKHRFYTFECYEPSDCEAIFRNRKALKILKEASAKAAAALKESA